MRYTNNNMTRKYNAVDPGIENKYEPYEADFPAIVAPVRRPSTKEPTNIEYARLRLKKGLAARKAISGIKMDVAKLVLLPIDPQSGCEQFEPDDTADKLCAIKSADGAAYQLNGNQIPDHDEGIKHSNTQFFEIIQVLESAYKSS